MMETLDIPSTELPQEAVSQQTQDHPESVTDGPNSVTAPAEQVPFNEASQSHLEVQRSGETVVTPIEISTKRIALSGIRGVLKGLRNRIEDAMSDDAQRYSAQVMNNRASDKIVAQSVLLSSKKAR